MLLLAVMLSVLMVSTILTAAPALCGLPQLGVR